MAKRYRVAVAGGTIDETVWAMIGSKHQVLDGVRPGSETEETASAAAELAWQLTQAGLACIDAT